MDEARIKLFVDLLRHRSLRQAAHDSFMTEPTLNNRLKTLERELGVKLIERTPRGISLTPEGEVFAALAPRLLGTWQEIRKAMNPTSEVNELWIGAGPHIASQILPKFLAYISNSSFKNASGIAVCHPPELIQGLESGRFQIGLLHSVPDLPNIRHYKLFEDRLVFISGEPLAPIQVEEINKWNLYAPVREFLAWRLIESFFSKHSVKPRSTVHVNNPLLITQIVRNQPGLRGVVAEGMLTNLNLEPKRSPFPVETINAQLPTIPTYVLWRKDEPSGRTAEFVDLLIKFVQSRRPAPEQNPAAAD